MYIILMDKMIIHFVGIHTNKTKPNKTMQPLASLP